MLSVQRMRTQTSVGFAEVYATHRDPLLRFAVLLCGDREVAEDACADAFATTWPRWERGSVDDVGAYLRRTVANNLNTFWRRRALRRNREERRLTGDRRGHLSAADAVADRDAVLGAVHQLPHGQRAAVVLRFYEDRTTHQIAQLLDIEESSVRSRLSRAAETLRTQLGSDMGGMR